MDINYKNVVVLALDIIDVCYQGDGESKDVGSLSTVTII